MERPPEELRFVKNVEVMADAIYSGVQTLHQEGYKVIDPKLILLAKEIIRQFDPNELIQDFIKNSQEHWCKVKKRDEAFFIHNAATVFKQLPIDIVLLFKDLFLTVDKNNKSVVSDKLKNSIWELFDAMIKIAIRYIYRQRKINIHYFNHINLEEHATMWQIVLN
ncbi:MAG TPA: hypothetical protein VLG50_07220 [Candidatus Saccharimonadales bacterium]|nr:hypothetical protein [Candidatus Saccharimonadales bacterium]